MLLPAPPTIRLKGLCIVVRTGDILQLYCIAMCGRFRLTRASKLAERFVIEPEDDWVPRFNIAPAQNIPVIRQRQEEPKRFGSKMRWGLIPYWAKYGSIDYKMINARAETVATNIASRPAFCEVCKEFQSTHSRLAWHLR
jgi:SOS response associated peptidase (SRAP)